MKVEKYRYGAYKVVTGIVENADAYDVIIEFRRSWKIVPPFLRDRSERHLTDVEARALGRALVLAADWAMEQNAKERDAND